MLIEVNRYVIKLDVADYNMFGVVHNYGNHIELQAVANITQATMFDNVEVAQIFLNNSPLYQLKGKVYFVNHVVLNEVI